MERWRKLRALRQSHPECRYSAETLVGIKELANILGLEARTTLTTWRARTPGVAEPIVVLGNGPIYDKWEFLLSWNDSVPDRRKPGKLSEDDAYALRHIIEDVELEYHEYYENS